MSEFAGLAFLLSIDNLRLATALGLLGGRRRWWRLALLTAAAEAGFPLLGAAFGPGRIQAAASLEHLGPALLLAAAGLSVVGALRGGGPLPAGPLVYALPPLFALDNLLAGAALGPLGIPAGQAAIVTGTLSGLLSLLAMAAAARLARPLGRRRAWAPAGLALALGALSLVVP